VQRGGILLAVALTLAVSPAVAAAQTSAQPDLAIVGRGDAFLVGDDLYNADGVGQQRNLIAGRHATFDVVLENEGARAESFLIQASAATAGFHVTYHQVRLSGVRDLTAAVVGDGLTWTIRPHGKRPFVVFVDADTEAPLGAVQSLLITATSTADRSSIDAVRVTITNVSTPLE
jgi:hypothetical protein